MTADWDSIAAKIVEKRSGGAKCFGVGEWERKRLDQAVELKYQSIE